MSEVIKGVLSDYVVLDFNKPANDWIDDIVDAACVIADTRYNVRLATPVDVRRAIERALLTKEQHETEASKDRS